MKWSDGDEWSIQIYNRVSKKSDTTGHKTNDLLTILQLFQKARPNVVQVHGGSTVNPVFTDKGRRGQNWADVINLRFYVKWKI